MKRRGPRIRGQGAVGIIRNGKRELAHLQDYSSEGVCLDGLDGVLAGDQIKLHCKGVMIGAEVRWVRGNRAGLCYAASVPMLEKTRFVAAVARGQKPASAARIHGFSELA